MGQLGMMAHTYSTDSTERRYIPFFIAAAAIAATFLAFHFTDKYHFTLPWWASPPIDTMAFYGLFYSFFDRYMWKFRVMHRLRITKIPDLSGTWHGRVHPVETGGVSAGLRRDTDITVSIQQTWTTMLIVGHTTLSKSHSLSGSLITTDEYTLSYEYINEPSASAPNTMHTHRGVARLTANDAASTMLEGEYYSGRDRQNIGTIRLTRS
jgi:hypothetical protein